MPQQGQYSAADIDTETPAQAPSGAAPPGATQTGQYSAADIDSDQPTDETTQVSMPERIMQDLGTKVSEGWQNLTHNLWGANVPSYVGPINPIKAFQETVQPFVQAAHGAMESALHPSLRATAKAVGANVDEYERRANQGDVKGVASQLIADIIPVLATYGLSLGTKAVLGGGEAAAAAGAPGEAEAATAAAKTGLPAGAPAAKFPAAEALPEESIQQPLQQGIKETFAKAANETGVKPLDPAAPMRDVASDMGEQIKARAQAGYKKLDDASGGRWQRFNDAIDNAKAQYDELVGIEDERAEAARENIEKWTEQRDTMVKQLVEDKKIDATTADQANEDYATQSALGRVDRAIKPNTRPASGPYPETVHNPMAIERRLQALADDPFKPLQRAIGEDNANVLLDHVRSVNNALAEIKAFKADMVDIPASGQARLNEMIAKHSSAAARMLGKGTRSIVDWNKVLNDFVKMRPGEQALSFGDKVAAVRRYIESQARVQAWGKATGGVGRIAGKAVGLEDIMHGKLLTRVGAAAKAGAVVGGATAALPVAAVGTSGLATGEEEPSQ